MRIVLCCAGGFSTTMLMNNMKKTLRESKKLNEADFEFIAVPVDLLKHEGSKCDVVVVGPQIAHKIDYIKEIIGSTPYTIIDQDTYGKMDGATALKMALIAHKKAEIAKGNIK
ncbi:PTS sugar transporter subunit IIB [Clostridium sp. AL.422]|uniref:PTS sugar transporter subunit IIB n=1 Tax=Clostridium TaxID=1485 RepID=UPI00293DD236|nr:MULTISPECIES: PTS sugar transporter subunit IIB [unclassified Clostridium]MDV4150364.1 PTS sugar transporter subunit IIB [Clostridium sp. AL.422]